MPRHQHFKAELKQVVADARSNASSARDAHIGGASSRFGWRIARLPWRTLAQRYARRVLVEQPVARVIFRRVPAVETKLNVLLQSALIRLAQTVLSDTWVSVPQGIQTLLES